MNESTTLEFTGERFTPECEREIAYEHWHRYAWAQQLLIGKDVIDAACGEGYGSYLLSQRAHSVVGFDLSEQSVEHAQRRYVADNLSFQCANCLELPLDEASVDAVVSFETLEHLAEHDQLMEEFKRVLRPDGCLIISSPDRKAYSDDTGYDNPFHVRELYRHEFEALMGRHFPVWRLCAQKLAFASVLWTLSHQGEESHWLTADDQGEVSAGILPRVPPMYFIAVAARTEQALPKPPRQSLYGDARESVYGHYYDVIRKHIRGEQLLAERDAEIAALEQKLARPWWKRWLADR